MISSSLVRRSFGRAIILSFFGLALGQSGEARAEFLTALVSGPGVANALVTVDTASPNTSTAPLAISFAGAATGIIDIDYRPANGLLYGLGRDNGIYTINTTTGLATLVSTLSTPLVGNLFGIDFNPMADALRIVSDTRQNLAVNVATGVATVQTALSQSNVVAVGYTNNVAGATSTTLYDINYDTNSLLTQIPPAAGTLNNVGSLGVDVGPLVGFDISGATGVAYVSANLAGSATSSLHTINLATGAATQIGTFGLPENFTVRGISAFPVAVPEPASLAMVGIGIFGAAGFGLARRKSARASR